MKPYFKDELVEVINKVGDGQPSVYFRIEIFTNFVSSRNI